MTVTINDFEGSTFCMTGCIVISALRSNDGYFHPGAIGHNGAECTGVQLFDFHIHVLVFAIFTSRSTIRVMSICVRLCC